MRARSAARSDAVAAPLASACCTSVGHFSDTNHTTWAPHSWANEYPPTPSTPLASVVTTMLPSPSGSAKALRGARGTPSLSSSIDVATSSSSFQSCAALPPFRSRSHSLERRQPLPEPPPAGHVTA
eukprot:78371-Pleurochrysis_carterae.AAC.1